MHLADWDGVNALGTGLWRAVLLRREPSKPKPVEEKLPMNLRVMQLSTQGSGEVSIDNQERVASRLVDLGLGVVGDLSSVVERPDGGVSFDDDDDDATPDDDVPSDDDAVLNEAQVSDDGCGCRLGPSPMGLSGLLALVPLGIVLRRRRRFSAGRH